jgi:hypothetical protein
MTTIAASPATPTSRSTVRTIARWMISFAGFPLGGLAALLLTGPVDSTTSAIAGGLVTGVVLGAVQAWAMRADRRLLAAWTLATALGLAAGLAIGASLVSFSTGLGDLAIQGAISGLAVGLAQAIPLVSRIGPVALTWPVYLAGAWAAGWVVSTLIGVQVSERFTVFGAAGAVTVALLTAVLPVFLQIRHANRQESPS